MLTGSRRLLERSGVITPALVRRILDTLAAASVAASSIGGTAAMAGATSTAHIVAAVRPVGGPRPPGKVVASQTATPPAPARVSVTALGRHFPHPGQVPHGLPAAASGMAKDEQVPSPDNGFAGLAAGTKVIVVLPGDCLSVLAERHLGDWRLDTEIETLNYGRPQPDGRALVDDHWIYPGWVLVMPANASGAAVVGGSPKPSPLPTPSRSQICRPRTSSCTRSARPRPGGPRSGGPGLSARAGGARYAVTAPATAVTAPATAVPVTAPAPAVAPLPPPGAPTRTGGACRGEAGKHYGAPT